MSVLKPFSAAIAVLQRVLDASLIALALWLANQTLDHDWKEIHTVAVSAAAALFLLFGEARRLYASWRLSTMDDEFGSVLMIWGVTCSALVIGAFLAKVSSNYSRLETLAWFCFTPALLIASRLLVRGTLRTLRRAGRNIRTVAIVGATDISRSVMRVLEESANFGVRVIGIFDDRNADRIASGQKHTVQLAGDIQAMLERSRQGDVDYVFIALPMRAEHRITELVNQLADTTASVYVVPDLFVFDLMQARLVNLGGLPAVSVYESPFDGLSGWIKRAEDLVLGSVLLLLSAIPMAVVSAALVLTSGGSIFFRQKRYGLNGRVVRVWKFRTMTVSEDGADVVQARPNDARITPVGKFLRATSIDELPQLFNVLVGEMSLVGPRPHAVVVNEQYRRLVHGYMLRHKVKPGITGWAQVNGWHGDDTLEKMQRRVEHDLEYLQNWSLWMDLKILAMTLGTVFSRRKTPSERPAS